VLALIKKFLARTGERGIPQGTPLNDLDHALDRGKALLAYARYLDDMVVLAPNSLRGRVWADRALELEAAREARRQRRTAARAIVAAAFRG